MSTSTFWIYNNFFEWHNFANDHEKSNIDWEKPYKYWDHSEKILTNYSDEMNLIDSISALKRAANLRMDHLNAFFNFKKFPIKGLPKNKIDLYSYFGLIKPLMVQQLLEIRNIIEHQYKSPPSLDRCKELLEFVWYFLRSTDALACYPIKSIVYDTGTCEQDASSIIFNIFPTENWRIQIIGSLKSEFVSFNKIEDWIQITGEINTIEKLIEIRGLNETQKESFLWNRLPTDYLIKADIINFTNDKLFQLITDIIQLSVVVLK